MYNNLRFPSVYREYVNIFNVRIKCRMCRTHNAEREELWFNLIDTLRQVQSVIWYHVCIISIINRVVNRP